MSKNLKKKFQKLSIFLFLLSIFISCFAFRDQLLTQITQLVINWVVKPESFIKFKAKKMHFGLDGACFEEVKIWDQEERFSLSLHRAKLCLTKKRNKISLFVNEANLSVDETKIKLSQDPLPNLFGYLAVDIKRFFLKFTGSSEKIAFSLRGDHDRLELLSKDQKNEKLALTLSLNGTREGVLEMKEFSLPKIAPLLHFFIREGEFLDLEKAQVSGKILASYQEGLFCIQNGQATINNCVIKDNIRDVEFRGQEIKINYNRQGSDFDLTSSVTGASILFNSAFQEANLDLSDLCGRLLYDSKGNRHFELSGKMKFQDQVQSILIQGEPKFSPHDLSCTINFALEGQNEFSGLSIHFGVKDNHKGFISLTFKNIDAQNAFGLKRFISPTFAEVEPWVCTSGTISGSINLDFLHGKLLQLHLNRIHSKNLELYDEDHDYKFCFPEFELALLFNPSQIGLKKIDKLHFVTQKAGIELPLLGKIRNFENVDMQLSMANGSFESSFFKCYHKGILSQVVFLGDFNNLELEGYFRSNFSDFFSIFDQKGLVVKDSPSCLSFQAQKKQDNLVLSSSLILDGREDQKLELNAQSSKFSRFDYKLIDCFDLHSKFLSPSLLDAFLQRIEPSLNLQGCFNFDLIYANNKYVLDFIGNELRAKRDNIILHSHTNVSGDRAVIAHLELDEDFNVDKGCCRFDNFFIKDEDSDLELRQVKIEGVLKKRCFLIESFKFDAHGIDFKGKGVIRSASNGLFARFTCLESIGSITQINTLFNHIGPLKEFQIPCTGQIMGAEGGIELNLAYQNELCVDYKLDLLCKHGTLPLNETHSLEDLSLRFLYNSKENIFYVCQATAMLKAGAKTPLYTVKGDGRYLEDGKVQASIQGIKEEKEVLDFRFLLDTKTKQCSLQEKSHLLSIALDNCIIGKEKISMACPLSHYELKGLLEIAHDLDFVSDGLFKKSSKGLSALKFNADFLLEGSIDEFKASLCTKNLHLYNEAPLACDLNLNKDLDQIVSTTIDFGKVKGHANFKIKDTALELQELIYNDSSRSIHIDKGWLDFNTWHFEFDHCLQLNSDEGLGYKVSLKGSSAIDFNESQVLCKSSSDLTFASEQQGFSFSSQKPVFWSLDSSFRVHCQEFCGLFSIQERGIDLKVCTLDVQPFNEMNFIMKGEIAYKSGVQSLFQYAGLDSSYGNFLEPIDSLGFTLHQEKGKYFGSFDLDQCLPKHWPDLVSLNNTKIEFDKNHLYLSANCSILNDTLLLSIDLLNQKSLSAKLMKDEVQVALLEGYLSPQKGLVLTQCLIDHFGLSLNLSEQGENESKASRYFVQANLCLLQLKKALNVDLLGFIDHFELDKGLSVNGAIIIFPQDLKRSYFEGQIKGKNCDLLGYSIDSMFCTFFCDQKSAIMQDFSCADEGLFISIPEISITTDKKGRHLRMPEFRVKNLRPSALKRRDDKKTKLEPFIVQELLIKDVQGSLDNIQTLKGKGRLVFENHAPRDHHIAKLPLEFISSLGLDRSLLVPVQGTIDCDLKGQSLVFTNLKDSYSQGRRSLFFLCNKEPSYIDLKGNIHMNIKMKQNVLFKFTELFVLSIRGTLDEPSFSLQ